MKKIAIMGSTQYKPKMEEHARKLIKAGYAEWVKLPALDDHDLSPIEIMYTNLEIIQWADEVHLFWDCRSPGAWGDFCMAFALRKPVRAIFLENKTMRDVIEAYAMEGK